MRAVAYPKKIASQLVLLCGLLLPLFSGCSYLPWPESYGEVSGTNSMRSMNGLGVHRRMWESTGAKILSPQKLSPRLDSIDTIVLVDSSYKPPGSLARDWLEAWLGRKSGRTVVYFGRDFDARLMYREDTLQLVSATQLERAQTQLASQRAQNYVERNSQIPEDTFCRWFYLRTSARPTVHEKFTGPWAKEVAGLDGKWPTGVLLEPPEEQWKSKKPSWMTGAKPTLAPARTFVVGADADQSLGDKEVQRSVWQSNELDDAEAWDSEWALAGSAQVLLAGANGAPLVHQIKHSKFPGSKILIVANGAPFTNASLVKPLHRKISELIIEDCLPAKRVAMIEFDENGLLLSNVASSNETNFGVQLLTVWPLSAITMHAAFFGIIAFVVMLPILGRPQSLARRTVTDFGLHVEAMGRMLFESRDLLYGLKSIQDYYTKVRRETPPDWLTQMMAQENYHQATLAAAKQNSQKSNLTKSPPPTSAPVSSGTPESLQQVPRPTESNAALQAEILPDDENDDTSKTIPTNRTPPDPVS